MAEVDTLKWLAENGLLTPAMLGIFMAAIYYLQNKAIQSLQQEVKAIAVNLSTVSVTLATTVAVLQRIDDYGTKAYLRGVGAPISGRHDGKA